MDTISAVLGIIVIDLVLSGDNAIVIGMAAHRLPPKQRRLAILVGGGAAILLRISLTAVAALLLTIPGLQAVGGLLLLWIAFKLLKEEEEDTQGVRTAGTFRSAVLTILLADVVMSLDNVLGVAAASNGNLELLLFGLVLSVAILMLGGNLVAKLVDRLWWLAYVGAGVIAWTGTDLLLEDPFLAKAGTLPPEMHAVAGVAVTAVVLTLAHLVNRRRPAQRVS
jgi:YjbE family integral membrane protein